MSTIVSKTASRSLVLALALFQVVCHQAILTAPPGSTITVVANPEFIAANGEVSVISALVIEPAGTPVPDGTVVQFFTTLGRIEEQGKTNDGVARVNLVSDTRSGNADITAASGDQVVVVNDAVRIGSGRPSGEIIMAADPNRIRPDDPRRSRITANVFDENFNPVRNTPVFFSIDGAPSTEFMESGGAPIFTDANGQAFDVLRTRYPRDDPPKTVIVIAVTGNDVRGSVQVTIN
jgi:hypothetical protein